MSSAKVSQLQVLQQNLQNLLMQKQQLESQLVELNSALTELKTTEKAYKIMGKIMVASSKDDLSHNLTERKEVINIRIKNITKQEESLKKNLEKLQKEVVAELQKNE